MHRCINRLYTVFRSLLPLHACTLHCLKRYIVVRNLLYNFDFFSWQAIRNRFATLRNTSPMRHDTQWRSFDHRTFLSFLSSRRGRSTPWNILFHFFFSSSFLLPLIRITCKLHKDKTRSYASQLLQNVCLFNFEQALGYLPLISICRLCLLILPLTLIIVRGVTIYYSDAA